MQGFTEEEPVPDDPRSGRPTSTSDQPPEFGLNVVSPRHCVACNACGARFRRVGATCQSCGADYARVGVTILPLTASDKLFEQESAARNDRRAARRFRLGFWRRGLRTIAD